MYITNEVENGILLSYGEAYAAADTASISKTITATVMPADAPNKLVDWSVAWIDETPLASKNISDYIKITPKSDGSNEATVTCYKGFEGSQAVITVTTRAGGYKASCQVNYLGIPESMTVNMGGLTSAKDSAWGVDMYTLSSGQQYTLDIGLDNTLHAVGSTFDNYTLSVEAHGGVNYGIYVLNSDGTVATTKTSTATMNAYSGGETLDTSGRVYASIQCGNTFATLFLAKAENGKLVVSCPTCPTAIQANFYSRSGNAVYKYDSYKDDKCLYYTLTIKVNGSNVTKTINFKSVASVTGVSLSSSSLNF